MKSTQWAAIFHALAREKRMTCGEVHFVALHVFTLPVLFFPRLTAVGEGSSNAGVGASGQKSQAVDKQPLS